jgi:anti-anti-sigma factor
MRVETKVSKNKKEVVISVIERFDFSQHQFFRDAYSQCKVRNTTFFLNLSRAEYMDSSALGMILLLKDHADKLAGKVIIQKPSNAVSKILEIAQFHQLMTIEP